jgi:DNA modification methylase
VTNRLFYGDNLDVLREHIGSQTVDLVYLDPPFNSNRNYNVIFAPHDVKNSADAAQIQAFDDSWHWTPVTEEQYREAVSGGLPSDAADALRAFRTLLGKNDAMAYLVNMAPRMVELRRVLTPTGSLYLHADPTMSHYLKVLLDATFGAEHFRNEVIWHRTSAKGSPMQRLPNNHDVILCYRKSELGIWNPIVIPYDMKNLDRQTAEKYGNTDENGRRYQFTSLLHPEQGKRPNLDYELMGVRRTWRWSRERMEQAVEDGRVVQTAPGRVPREKRYLDEQEGRLVGDVWTDIPPLNSQAAERLGYPTQKPLALLERIIRAASNEGDLILDPFCGCGTTVDAAQRLERRWTGIDITFIAVDLMEKRLIHTYGEGIRGTYEVTGIPRDLGSAHDLARRKPFDFERWAVSLVHGQPNEKQVGDRGMDGVVGFNVDTRGNVGRVLVSVKGGKQLGPDFVREIGGTVQSRGAEMGLLITMHEPTRGMREEADHAGTYRWPVNGVVFPRVQIVTIEALLAGRGPKMPPAMLPYIAAARRRQPMAEQQLSLDEVGSG